MKAMPEDAYRARVAVDATPQNAIGPSSELTLLGSVTNISPCVWSQPEYGSIRLGNHWLDRHGETMLIQDDGRTYLPGTLGPGDTFRFALNVRAPAREDEYQCEIDVVHEGINWFGDKGSDSARFTVRVSQRPDEDESVADEPVGGVLVNISKGHVQGAGRDALVGPRLPDIYDDLPAATEDPGDFPMHGIHREAILKLIRAYFWLFAVPFLARGLSRLKHLLSFEVFGQRIVIELSLPFSWRVFYFASLFFGVGTLIYLLRCPRIVADHTDAAHFLGAGKSWGHLNEYASDLGRTPVSRVGYTGMSYNVGPQVETPEASYFWSIYGEALKARPVALTLAVVFYTIGFGFIAWLLSQNFFYVARVLMESRPSSGA